MLHCSKSETWPTLSFVIETSLQEWEGGISCHSICGHTCCLTQMHPVVGQVQVHGRGGPFCWPWWPSVAPAYLGWAGASGARTCHLRSRRGSESLAVISDISDSISLIDISSDVHLPIGLQSFNNIMMHINTKNQKFLKPENWFGSGVGFGHLVNT